MKRFPIPLVLALLACPAAEAGESPWTFRFHGAIVHSSAQRYSATINGLTSRVEVGPSGGIGAGAEYRFSGRIGLDLSVLLTALEIETTMSTGAPATFETLQMSMMPVTLALPFHFDAGDRTEVYLAPSVSHVSYLDTRSSVGPVETGVTVGSEIAFGAALGLESGFGRGGWAFDAGLRYMKAAAGDRDIDPLIATVGLAYRLRSAR